MVFVTAILQDACLSIKVVNKPVYLNFKIELLKSFLYPNFMSIFFICLSIKLAVLQLFFCHFLNISFHQGGQQPGWERGERYLILCLSKLTFSNVFFFQTDRVCWFAGWPCRMFCSNLCLSERNASGRFSISSQINSCFSFLLIPLQLLDRRRRERGGDDPGGDPRGQRGELHRQERHPDNLQDRRESWNWLKSIIVAEIVKEYT